MHFESKYRRFMILKTGSERSNEVKKKMNGAHSGVEYSLLDSFARMLGDSTSSFSNVVQ